MKAIGVIRRSRRDGVSREEFEELLRSAGYEVLAILEQNREEHPRYNIGKGKLEELKELVKELKPDKVIFANRLTPSQAYNLWKELRVEVIDRWQLVLEIFEKRAHSKEAKLQVELASLQYEVPLVKEAIRRIKLGDRAGFKGMGEYQTQQYLKHIRYRMGKIRKELERVKADREVKRKRREEVGFILIALAGYTNAGKSTLLNALAGEEIEARNQMFTTLDTTTRRFKLGGKRVLVTDTVGFIDGLPPFIVEAFHSTLEEIVKADIILLVLDASEPWTEMRRKFLASLGVLRELKALDKPIIVVLNKRDLTSEEDIRDKAEIMKALAEERGIGSNVVSISAKLGQLEELYGTLEEVILTLPKYKAFEITVDEPDKVPRVMALINSIGEILSVEYGEKTRIRAYVQTGMIKELTRLGVRIERLNQPHEGEGLEDSE
ncbi:GTP-binding protein, HflX family [Thermococcus cleftensis]|uniref:GTPase HflX n=1 Tax=Thermococcus cleftensis (strain DSM 27260 / KACC 17922 / CL1) TaxID=163003 RepID=I3ZUR6_THECF|nr:MULTISPECIES: GTPase HflX [Thermococcus]AFL95450.1 GTP-binding protein, HflX family [Thermococcus cleftensis]NJE04032.1 GTPase HflX [Thermococcus sp. MV11]